MAKGVVSMLLTWDTGPSAMRVPDHYFKLSGLLFPIGFGSFSDYAGICP